MYFGFGMMLMIASLIGIVIFSLILIRSRATEAKKKKEIYESIQDEYSRKG